MIPEDQMIVVFLDHTKKPKFSGRIAYEDNKSPLARGGHEKAQVEKARYILKFFDDHNTGRNKIDYAYKDTVHSPGKALIATHYLDKDKWGISTMAGLSEYIDHYFIGYAARSPTLSKFIFPYKYLDMFLKCIDPYFDLVDFETLRASIELSYKLKHLDQDDASAIANL